MSPTLAVEVAMLTFNVDLVSVCSKFVLHVWDRDMTTTFDYLIDKIRKADFSEVPFRHLEIQSFLSDSHFEVVSGHAQIKLAPQLDTESLIAEIERAGYKIIPFPGCVTSSREYLDWFHGRTGRKWHDATESFGIVYRLDKFEGDLLKELNEFLLSDSLKYVLIEKFGIERPVDIDAGIQKYLHGYEISPHPDIRRKAVTWMLNINPDPSSADRGYHTHYLKLKEKWEFISKFWKGNPEFDRDWLPWDWCETVKLQRKNNSIVIFSPSDDTIHAVKADYDHLVSQRTQLYGNLWYENRPLPKVDFRQFDVTQHAQAEQRKLERQKEIRNGALVQRFKASPAGQVAKAIKNRFRPQQENRRHVEF
jgi:hypothetical protein